MELTTKSVIFKERTLLFMMSKIRNLNGTHNINENFNLYLIVVYDVKDTKFEWNSQLAGAG